MFSSQMMQYVQNQEIHNIYVEYVFGSSINVHTLRNYLRKFFFSCVFITFLYQTLLLIVYMITSEFCMLKNIRRWVGMLACISICVKLSICREHLSI